MWKHESRHCLECPPKLCSTGTALDDLHEGLEALVRIARTASTRISESEDASRRRCRRYDIGRIPVHCCQLPLDNQGDKAPGAGEDGTQDPGDSPAGDGRRVTPLACTHRPVKRLVLPQAQWAKILLEPQQ